MTFLGIGPGELLLIAILTMVIVGPERLPDLARRLGRTLVTVRNWVQRSPDAAMVLRMREELENELATLRNSLAEVQSVRDEFISAAKQAGKSVEDDLVGTFKQASDELTAISRGSSRAAIVNGQAETVAPDLASLDAADPLPTIAPPHLSAPELPADPDPDGLSGLMAHLEQPAPLQTPATTDPPAAPLDSQSTDLAQMNARLESLAASLAALEAALRQRGLLDTPLIAGVEETHVHD